MTAYITNQVSLVTHLFPEGIEVVTTQNCNFKTCINQNSSNIQKQSLSRGLWSLSTWYLLICTPQQNPEKLSILGFMSDLFRQNEIVWGRALQIIIITLQYQLS